MERTERSRFTDRYIEIPLVTSGSLWKWCECCHVPQRRRTQGGNLCSFYLQSVRHQRDKVKWFFNLQHKSTEILQILGRAHACTLPDRQVSRKVQEPDLKSEKKTFELCVQAVALFWQSKKWNGRSLCSGSAWELTFSKSPSDEISGSTWSCRESGCCREANPTSSPLPRWCELTEVTVGAESWHSGGRDFIN